MKVYKLFAITIILGFGIIACTDLTEVPQDELVSEQYFENFSEEDIPSALGPIYSDMRNLYAGFGAHFDGSWLWTSEETGDLWITPKRGGAWWDGGVYHRLNTHSWGQDHSHFRTNWRKFYQGVNTANRLLFQFQNADIPNKQRILSELRVARAFWYYNLADFFGNVPLVTKYDVPEDFLPEQKSRQEVVQFVIDELRQSIPHLPDQEYGKWDRYAAMHLLAKVYLNTEEWTDQLHWEETIAYCDSIIQSGNYQLEPDYSNVFVTHNEDSPEIIMAIPNHEIHHDDNPFVLHLWTHHWKFQYHRNTDTGFWGGVAADPQFIDSYHDGDKRLEKSWFWGQLYDNVGGLGPVGDSLFCDPWNPRDQGKPLKYTKEIEFGQDGITSGEHDGYRMAKYEIKEGAKQGLENDFVLFRYAEVFFMKAEALWRKNGRQATQEAVNLINRVRTRAFDNYTGDKVLTNSELDGGRFLKEYAWEFTQEGNRRQVLIRFDKFTSKTWTLKEQPSEEYRKLFPIPQQEIEANPNLEQNPGY